MQYVSTWQVLVLITRCRAAKWGEWIPDVHAWRERLDYRAEQVRRIASNQEKWDGMMNLATTGLLVPNYTALGYEVIATPTSVHEKLNSTLVAALRSGRTRSEHQVDQISGPTAQFVNVGGIKAEIMTDLQPILEAWVRVLGRRFQDRRAVWSPADAFDGLRVASLPARQHAHHAHRSTRK